MDWQPIETAPRDGTQFLGYHEPSGEFYLVDEADKTLGDLRWANSEDCAIVLTHWAPLAPPRAKREAA